MDTNMLTKTFPFDPTKAAMYLKQWEELCKKDGGKLWGVALHTPFVIVDEETRDVAANEEGFGEKFPEELAAGTTAIKHNGKFWAMADWDMVERYGDDDTERMEMFVHEAFHALQPSLFGGEVEMGENPHLNELDARVLFLVEMDLLLASIKNDADERLDFARAALFARAQRREKYGPMAETVAELLEGKANYTQYMVTNSDNYVTYLETESPQGENIARNFGYFSGAMYCYALDAFGVDWKSGLTWDSDLGEILNKTIGISEKPPSLFETKHKEIMEKEMKRQEEINRKLQSIITAFTTRPLLRCSLESDRGGVNMFIQVAGLGQIRRGVLQCNGTFGRMFVNNMDELMQIIQSDGEYDFLEHNDGYCAVFADGLRIEGNKVIGKYWTLELNEGYEVIADGNNYEIRAK